MGGVTGNHVEFEGSGGTNAKKRVVGFQTAEVAMHNKSKAPTVFSAFSESPESFIGPTASSMGGLVKLLSNAKENLGAGGRAAARSLSTRREEQFVEYRPRVTSWDVQPDARPLWYDGHCLLFNPDNWFYQVWWRLSAILAYWTLFQVSLLSVTPAPRTALLA
jgi:hypothetical protein